MRILLLTTSFPVKKGASSGVFVERLAKRLGLKCDVSVLAPAANVSNQSIKNKSYNLFTFRYAPVKWQILAHGGGGIPPTLKARPYTVLLLPFFVVSMFFNTLWYSRKVDLIFANWSICGVVAGVAGRVSGKPVLTTLRGEDANRAKSSRINRFIVNLCLKLNRRIVTVSNDLERSISIQFPSDAHKIVMIPNGVEMPLPLKSVEKMKEPRSVNLVSVGSIIPRKDLTTALKALSMLPQEFTLTIIGDGPERSRMISLSKELDIESRVIFIGHIVPEKITNYLKNFDVFLITSISEGRPNALLEACACGVPVVGSNIPGIREIIVPDINGVLFPVGEHETLARKLFVFSDISLRRRLGDAGRRLIEERGLTWENTADKYMQQFRNIL